MFRLMPNPSRPARLVKDALGFFFAVTLMSATALSMAQGAQQVANPEESLPVTVWF